MESKFCPSCNTEVPAVATRCKACFHEFNTQAKARKSGGPLLILLAITMAALLLVGAAYYRASRPVDQRVHIDANTQTIHWVTQYQSGDPKTDRISFSQVDKLEYRTSGAGRAEIWAITLHGERKLLAMSANQSLEGTAEHYATMMNKPLVKVGFLEQTGSKD